MITFLLIVVIIIDLGILYIQYEATYKPYQDYKFEKEVAKMRQQWELDHKEKK